MPTERALAPRFSRTSLFYLSLSARGTGDGLWRVQNGQAFEVRKGADGVLSEPPAVSPDGSRVAVVVQTGWETAPRHHVGGRHRLTNTGGVDRHPRAWWGKAPPTGRPTATGSSRAAATGRVRGLFMIPVDGGAPVRLVAGEARNPVWSPKGDLIVYATPFKPVSWRSGRASVV